MTFSPLSAWLKVETIIHFDNTSSSNPVVVTHLSLQNIQQLRLLVEKGSNQTGLNKIVSNQITQASITFVKFMCILIRCTGPLKKRLVSDGKLYSENVNCFVYFGPQCIPLMLDIPGTSTVEAKILGKPILFY